MKQSEREALQQAYDMIGNLLEGKAPAPAPRPAPARPTRARAAVPEGEVHATWNDKEKGFDCNLCNAGTMKVGETAEHLYTEHGLGFPDFNIEGQTHGRKWQMKKYLEKNAPKALKGVGKKKLRPKPKPKTERRWRARAAVEEGALEETRIKGNPRIAIWHPDGDSGHSVAVELVGQWRYKSQNIQIKEIDNTPGAGKILTVPKRHVFIKGNPPGSYVALLHGPLGALEEAAEEEYEEELGEPEVEEKRPSWRRGPLKPKPKAKVARGEKAFAEKYGLSGKQLTYVKDFAEEKGLTLAQAAEELDLEVEE